MNLSALQTFLAVVQTGNLNRAAERLNVTQSTVTARLDTLEDALGQRLLLRSRKGAVLTKAGFALQRHVEMMLQSWDLAKRTVGLPKEFSGLLSIACESDLWTGLGASWLADLRRTNPENALEAWPGSVEEIRRWLTSGLVDAALAREPLAGPGFSSKIVTRDRIVLISTVLRPVQDWASDYVYVDHGSEFRRWHARTWPGDHVANLSFGGGEWALAHLSREGGSAYLPLRLVETYLLNKELFLIEDAPEFKQAIHLANRDSGAETRAAIDASPMFQE